MDKLIRFGEPQELELPPAELPAAELLANPPDAKRNDPFQVYILGEIYDQILDHLNVTLNIESGGVLVGHPFRTPDGDITFVVITAAIPQHSDNRSIGHFTVNTAEIAATRDRIEKEYPGHLAVGWYHSHPGHGIFLSGQDMTIVRSIYNASWQIALVIDPERRTEGIFVGPEGRQLGGRAEGYRERPLWTSFYALSEAPDYVGGAAEENRWREESPPIADVSPVTMTEVEISSESAVATQRPVDLPQPARFTDHSRRVDKRSRLPIVVSGLMVFGLAVIMIAVLGGDRLSALLGGLPPASPTSAQPSFLSLPTPEIATNPAVLPDATLTPAETPTLSATPTIAPPPTSTPSQTVTATQNLSPTFTQTPSITVTATLALTTTPELPPVATDENVGAGSPLLQPPTPPVTPAPTQSIQSPTSPTPPLDGRNR